MSDLNNFFPNRRIMTATSIPTVGKFKVGDLIVNIGPTMPSEPMWVCTEAGEPGVWQVATAITRDEYEEDLKDIDEKIDEAKQLGNDVKQLLVDALIAKGIPISTNGTDNTFENLVSQITAYTSFTNRQSTYTVSVTAGQTLTLQNTTRGCYNFSVTNPNYVITDWGDGTKDNKLTHTYAAANTYTIATPYSFAHTNGTKDAATMNSLVKVGTLRSPMTTMAHCCSNARNLTNKPVCGSGVKNMYAAYYNCANMPGPAACGANVTNMSKAYSGCTKLTGNGVCGAKVTNFSYAYENCYGLTGTPACGAAVTNMQGAYSHCNKLTGAPVCGNNVTDMSYAYQYSSITGAPVCGPNVTNMVCTYDECFTMSGNAVCGAKVTNMYGAYYNCNALRGAAAIGANVKDASYAYYNCRYINGTAPCSSNNITNLAYAFYYCHNITSPGNIGANVTNMAYCFYNCNKWTANFNMYIYSRNVVNAVNCFYNKYASRYINVHVPANSTTLNTFLKNTAADSVVGKAITWSHNTSNKCYYNTTSGIRVRIYYTL